MTDLSNEARERPIAELTADELDVVTGGKGRSEKIHIDYHRLDNFNDPTAVRYA